jgi:3-oxoacyl-[acyl-carrier protein] reductase
MKNKTLNGKHVLVTGGANGIGEAIVKEFLEQGARVSFFDIDKINMARVSKKTGAKGYLVDVANYQQVKEIFKIKELRAVDVLINDAAVNPSFDSAKLDFAVWDRVLKTNLYGSFNTAKFVVENMIKRKTAGSIIFISSVHTAMAFSGYTAYDAAKHGMIGLMRVLALDLAKYGIRCNCVAPGLIYPTKMTGNLTKEKLKKLSSCIPMARAGTPKEVAGTVVFLASEAAAYINGVEIIVDGGLAIKNAIMDY